MIQFTSLSVRRLGQRSKYLADINQPLANVLSFVCSVCNSDEGYNQYRCLEHSLRKELEGQYREERKKRRRRRGGRCKAFVRRFGEKGGVDVAVRDYRALSSPLCFCLLLLLLPPPLEKPVVSPLIADRSPLSPPPPLLS